MKSLFTGRAGGWTIIKLASITGLILDADCLIICASGMASPIDFSVSNFSNIKQLPNCIVASQEELKELCRYLRDLF